MFDRVSLDLGSNAEQENKDTETRIKEFRSTSSDPELIATYFQFGRYLLISSSQPGTQPANLQGIGIPRTDNTPAWDSKVHYQHQCGDELLPAEVANLRNVITRLNRDGEDYREQVLRTAEKMYGAEAGHYITIPDLWGATEAVDNGSVGVCRPATHGSVHTFGRNICSQVTRFILQKYTRC